MLYVCIAKFNMMRNFKKFLVLVNPSSSLLSVLILYQSSGTRRGAGSHACCMHLSPRRPYT